MKLSLKPYSFTFDKIYVIESLPDKDKKTGTELYNDTIRLKVEQLKLGIEHELISVCNRDKFFEVFRDMFDEIRLNNFHPIIHFEIHGDFEGFVLKSGEMIKWEELSKILRNINIHTNNNTFLTLCVCYGIYIYKLINPKEPSPYWGTVSPKEEINPILAQRGYQGFFTKLLETLDINAAVKELNDEYDERKVAFFFRNSKFAFDMAYENYESKYFSKEIIDWRVNEAFVLTKAEYLEQGLTGYSDEFIKTNARTYLTSPYFKEIMKRKIYNKFTNNGKFSN